MKIKEKVRRFVDENKYLILGGCIAGYVAISIWESKTLKTVHVKDWKKVTGEGPFDILRDDAAINGAFATVE